MAIKDTIDFVTGPSLAVHMMEIFHSYWDCFLSDKSSTNVCILVHLVYAVMSLSNHEMSVVYHCRHRCCLLTEIHIQPNELTSTGRICFIAKYSFG